MAAGSHQLVGHQIRAPRRTEPSWKRSLAMLAILSSVPWEPGSGGCPHSSLAQSSAWVWTWEAPSGMWVQEERGQGISTVLNPCFGDVSPEVAISSLITAPPGSA